jgi:hypothetical protein
MSLTSGGNVIGVSLKPKTFPLNTVVGLAISCIAVALPQSASAEICLDKQLGDSYLVGESLTANQKYLAVGDSGANRVIVYKRTASQQWTKLHTILPPKNSLIDKIGRGFGYRLALTGDTLVIGAYASKQSPPAQEQALYPFQPPDQNGLAHTGAVYSTSIVSNTPLKRLDKLLSRELSGFSVVADSGRIAFGVLGYNNRNQTSKSTTLLSANSRRTINIGGEIALRKNRLVVGQNIDKQQGHISIFNLINPDAVPEVIKVPLKRVSAIELTDKFMIISEEKYLISTSRETSEAKILVFDPIGNSFNLLAGPGNISAHGNLLISSYPTTDDSEISGKIDLFDLTVTPPKMFSTSKTNVRQSFLTKNLLFKTVNFSDFRGESIMICITPINH